MSGPLARVPEYPVREVIIDPSGNLTVRVEELNHELKPDPLSKPPVLQVTFMRVSSEKLLRTGTEYLAQLLGVPTDAHRASACSFNDVSCTAAEVVLRVLHDVFEEDWIYFIDLTDCWEVAHVCQKYGIDCKALSLWFNEWYAWYENNDIDELEPNKLLYLYYVFNHADAFHEATKSLAYQTSGKVEEHNPTRHKELRLPRHFVGAINFARRTLYRKLMDAIIGDVIGPLLATDNCEHRFTTLGHYIDALWDAGVRPHYKSERCASVQSLLDGLDSSSFAVQDDNCHCCDIDFDQTVACAVRTIQHHFTGLCLDRMNRPSTGSQHDDYEQYKIFEDSCESSHLFGGPTRKRKREGTVRGNSPMIRVTKRGRIQNEEDGEVIFDDSGEEEEGEGVSNEKADA